MDPEREELYRELILDHWKRPRGRQPLEHSTHEGESTDPRGGEVMQVWLRLDAEGRIEAAAFAGEGSAVAIASGSMLTLAVQGLTREEALGLANRIRAMLTAPDWDETEADNLGNLAALSGIRHLPARVTCALRAWQALENALG